MELFPSFTALDWAREQGFKEASRYLEHLPDRGPSTTLPEPDVRKIDEAARRYAAEHGWASPDEGDLQCIRQNWQDGRKDAFGMIVNGELWVD